MAVAATVERVLGHGVVVVGCLVGAVLLLTAGTTAFFVDTMVVLRFRRDVMRMVAEDDLTLLEALDVDAGLASLRLEGAAALDPPRDRPYLVVSLEENQLWLKQSGQVLFATQVATGSGKTLVKEGGGSVWKFETPRGRLIVQGKERDPAWVPPDWHYVEQARKRGLGMAHLQRGGSIATADGATITVQGDDVVKAWPGGRRAVLQATDGREIVAEGKLIVPPLGTNQRRYGGVLGAYRLNLGSGYALHGTNRPETIGRSVSHGCIRLRNEDITRLFDLVPVGTPVYIY